MFLAINLTDIVSVLFLILLEGLLSMDNALALAVTVRHLPAPQQKKALTYGIWGAFVFRFCALFFLSLLLELTWVKFLGGGYLLWLTFSEFFCHKQEKDFPGKTASAIHFWKAVVTVELMDIAFSVDSILAAVSVSKKFWIVLTGGILGIVMMRFAAVLFIKLMEWFPRLEKTAYLLIGVIGAKLVLEGMQIEGINFNSSSNAAFGLFWLGVVLSVGFGFSKGRLQRMA